MLKQKRSRVFFEKLWDGIIHPEMELHVKENGVSCPDFEEARESIWIAYRAYNTHVSQNYMKDASKPLDRHKVASCYMYAVLAAHPLQIDDEAVARPLCLFANEMLAVTVGCTVLVSFLKTEIDGLSAGVEDDAEIFKQEKDRVLKKLEEEGIKLSSKVGHGGSYYRGILRALHYVSLEHHYSVLLLAIILYEWEGKTIGLPMQERIIGEIREQTASEK